jgi:hypothetical protein
MSAGINDLTKMDAKTTIHEIFKTDLSRVKTHEEAFDTLSRYYSALVELVQPDANDKGRMRNIRLMTPKIGNALLVYHAFVLDSLNQIKRLEQRKSTFQRVKEWFRRGK